MKKRKKSNPIVTFLKYAVIFILVAAVAFFTVVYAAFSVGDASVSNITDSVNTLFNKKSTGGFPYKLGDTKLNKMCAIGSSLCLHTDRGITVLNKSAAVLGKVNCACENAKIKTCSGRALIYNDNSNTVELVSKTQSIGKTKLGGEILTCTLGKNGSFAAAFDYSKAESKVEVYNKRQKLVYEWKCGSERVTDISLSPDCKRLAVTCLGAENAQVYSRLLVFSLSTEKPLCDKKYSGTMLVRVNLTADCVCAVGDNRYVVLGSDYNENENYSYPENTLSALSFDEDGNSVICLSASGGGKTNVIKFNSSGTQEFSTTLEFPVNGVVSDGGSAAVINGSTVTVLNAEGEAKKSETLESAPEQWCFTGGRIYALCENRIISK